MTDALEGRVPYPSAVPDGNLDRPRPPHRAEHRGVHLASLTVDHWPQVAAIYAAGIATGHATFETEPPRWETFHAGKLPEQRLVALNSFEQVLGWAAASGVSNRYVYRGVVEHSVYVDPPPKAMASDASFSTESSTPPRPQESGPSSPASSPRTRPVSDCTRPPASRSLAPAAGSAA